MFWGLIMEPLKRYSQIVGRSFHISQVALDMTTGDGEPSQVMVVVDEQKFLICTLQKGKVIQAQVDLSFTKGENIAFVANGKSHVHLTGYLDPYEDLEDLSEEEEEDVGSDEEEEEDEDVPQLVEANSKKAKRKLDTSVEMNSSKKIKKEAKKKVEKDSDSSDDASNDDSDSADENDLRKLLEASDSDEADDSYRPDSSKDDDESDDEDMEADELNEDDDSSEEKPAPQEEKKLSKKEKKKLKKQQQQQGTPQQNGHAEKKKEKGNKENEHKKGDGDKSPASAQKEKKVLTGNVAIEDLKMGQGAPAKPGKMIQVYYEGRLKSNNKMFDSCQKGPGFKFRLGKNEVIRGWDVGVAGMKVGGKRRIVCPPGMAYGNKGSPPLIPPNSTLVFDVELKGVN